MEETAQLICDRARGKDVQFADIRITSHNATRLLLQDQRADKAMVSSGCGAGIRVLVDGAWGFACADYVDQKLLLECLNAAIAMARTSSARIEDPGVVAEIDPVTDKVHPKVARDPRSVSLEEKVALLHRMEDLALKAGEGKIVNSIVSYGDSVDREIVCNTAGTLIEVEEIRTVISAMMVAQEGEVRQSGSERRGRPAGFEVVSSLDPEEFSVAAARRAVSLLSAKKAPSGVFPVVFHPTITGLLTHEALGHNAEGDSIWNGRSILAGRIGEQIASPLVSIIDDSTTAGNYGSYVYDSEGVPGQRCVIIENGVLRNFMHSLETAARFGVTPNGNARADGHSSTPIVRMSNTFMERGTTPFEELLKGIDRGVYLKDGHWGYVFVERGQFTCHAGEGQMIENGKLGEPLRDVSVSGMTLETLQDIDAVGDDFMMEMPGNCGKNGQGAPTDAGGPHVRVKRLVVGGVSE